MLDLLKRSEVGSDLTATQHDGNFTAIETEVNAKANTADLKLVAFSGVYADLTAKPTLGTAADNAEGDFATAAQGVKADTALQPNAGGATITNYVLPWLDITGTTAVTLTQATHGGRALRITGTPSSITVLRSNGFHCKIYNKSGAARTINPSAGNFIHDGLTKATLSLADRRVLFFHADPDDIVVDGVTG